MLESIPTKRNILSVIVFKKLIDERLIKAFLTNHKLRISFYLQVF